MIMKVIDIHDHPVIIEVPNNYIECSICGIYQERSSYTSNGVYQTRTNCKSCYELPLADWSYLEESVQAKKNSIMYKQLLQSLKEESCAISNSISVQEMIKALQELPSNTRLIIRQEGYYAEGNYADIYLPGHYKDIGEYSYYSIGISSQKY